MPVVIIAIRAVVSRVKRQYGAICYRVAEKTIALAFQDAQAVRLEPAILEKRRQAAALQGAWLGRVAKPVAPG
jgi:hypothetical protein